MIISITTTSNLTKEELTKKYKTPIDGYKKPLSEVISIEAVDRSEKC